MAIVHDKVTAQLFGCQVVNAARAISDVSQDQALDFAELADDVSNKCAMQQEAFWELKTDFECRLPLFFAGKDLIDCLGHFIVVIPREYTACFHKSLDV